METLPFSRAALFSATPLDKIPLEVQRAHQDITDILIFIGKVKKRHLSDRSTPASSSDKNALAQTEGLLNYAYCSMLSSPEEQKSYTNLINQLCETNNEGLTDLATCFTRKSDQELLIILNHKLHRNKEIKTFLNEHSASLITPSAVLQASEKPTPL